MYIYLILICGPLYVWWQIVEIILGGEVDKQKWKMPEEEEEEQEEFWGFEDLECECDSSFSTSPHDTFSTRSS